jgi:uncharacterized repeat protein (TIGR01451 family)
LLLFALAAAGCATRQKPATDPPAGLPPLDLGREKLDSTHSADPPPPDWPSSQQAANFPPPPVPPPTVPPPGPPPPPTITTPYQPPADAPPRPNVRPPSLQVGIEGVRAISPGDPVVLEVGVANTGDAPATNVRVRAELDAGLRHESGVQILEVVVGTLEGGQTTTVPLALTAVQSGKPAVHVEGYGDGNLRADAARAIIVAQRAMQFSLTGAPTRYVNRPGPWDVHVANTGDAPLANAVARVRLPHDLRFVSATGNGAFAGGEVVWTIGDLRPGERRELQLTAAPVDGTGQATLTGVATADKVPAQAAEATFEVMGMPVLRAEAVPPTEAIHAGGKGVIALRVTNQGTLAARNVSVAAVSTTPNILMPRFGVGPTVGRVNGERVEFAPVARIEAGQTVTFQIEIGGVQAGDGRLRVEIGSEMTPVPLTIEDAIRIAPPVATPGRPLPTTLPR